MATTQAPSSARLDPRIRYYMHRKLGNAIVPLIPADQLPFHLKDFPKHLSYRELSEGRWKFLDDTNEIPFPLALLSPDTQALVGKENEQKSSREVMIAKEAPVTETMAKDATLKELLPTKEEMSTQDLSTKQVTKEPMFVEQKSTPSTISNSSPVVKTKSPTDSMAAIYNRDTHRLGYTKHSPTIKRKSPVKEKGHCRHWIKTGNCKYIKQGCRYKHEMPALGKLKEIGFAEIPRWFQEKELASKKIIQKEASTADTEVYVVYTTNTVDEPMLMDFGSTDISDISDVGTHRTTSGIERTATSPQLSTPVSNSSATTTSMTGSPVGQNAASSSPVIKPSLEPASDNLSTPGGTTASPLTLTETIFHNPVSAFDIYFSTSAHNSIPEHILTPTKNASPGSTSSPQKQSPKSKKATQESSTLSKTANQTPASNPWVAQAQKSKRGTTKTNPTVCKTEEKDAKLAKLLNRPKAFPKKAYKARVCHSGSAPTEKKGFNSKVPSVVASEGTTEAKKG